jgi:hypothetical protein
MIAIFQEKQCFNQWWVWAIIYVVTLLPLVANKPMSNKGLSLVFIPLLGLALFLRSLRLTTTIDSDNIDLYFSPLVKKSIPWAEVASAKVIDYGFVGGWGIRLFTSYGTVYNIRGRMGLALELKSGKKLLIGTQKPTALKNFLAQL